MSTSELTLLSVHELAPLIAAKEISPVELVQACLERIDALNGRLKAFISVYPEQALAAAEEAEGEILAGRHKGPLHGVPVALKDLFQVAGMERTCGSAFYHEGVAESDCTSAARLRDAGAVIVGLLNLHEFAFGPTGINPNSGTAANPWDESKVCGGSSSGSGCAVAASLVPLALGSDTGGSIRIPAALCGTVGLKQTYGLASRHGIYPLSAKFDHGGPLTRSVRDAAIALQAIAGADANDPSTWAARVADYSDGLEDGIAGLRIGVPANYFFDNCHPEVSAAVRAGIEQFAALGAAIEEIELPFAAEAAAAWNLIALADAFSVHQDHIAQHGDELSADVVERLEKGRVYKASEYVDACWTRERVRREMAKVMTRVDLLIAPSSPIPAVSAAEPSMEVGGKTVVAAHVLGRYTRLACFTGQPSISLRCGMTADGLPVGLQLIANWFDDATMLRAGRAYEAAVGPWAWPELS